MKKGIAGIIRTIMGVMLTIIVVLAAFFIIVTFTMKGNGMEVPRIFGYSVMTVQSGSMEPTFSEGDVIIVKEIEDDEEETITYGTLPTPMRTGYTFDGWFTDPTAGTEVTEDTVCRKHIPCCN